MDNDSDLQPRLKPEPIVARSLGMLNLVFGTLFILASAYESGAVLAMPMLGKFLTWALSQEAVQRERAWENRQAEFEQRLKDSESDEEREAIEAERTLAELNQPRNPQWYGFSMESLDDPKLRAGALAKLGMMVTLHGLLIASGIGLIKLRPWGRATARLSALLLILATIGFAVATIGLVPEIAERWTIEMREVLFDLPKGAEVPAAIDEALGSYEEGMSRLFSAALAGSAGLAIVYPLVVLVIVSRPGVRRAVEWSKPMA